MQGRCSRASVVPACWRSSKTMLVARIERSTRSSSRKRCSSCTASRRRARAGLPRRRRTWTSSAPGGKGPRHWHRSYEMQKRIIEGVEVQRSSGNVFADLELADAEKLKIKTGLVVEIRKAMHALGLNQQAAAKRMGIPQPKVSGMMHGDFTNLSERKLMDCLNRLGYDIEIKVRPASAPIGHLTLATA